MLPAPSSSLPTAADAEQGGLFSLDDLEVAPSEKGEEAAAADQMTGADGDEDAVALPVQMVKLREPGFVAVSEHAFPLVGMAGKAAADEAGQRRGGALTP